MENESAVRYGARLSSTTAPALTVRLISRPRTEQLDSTGSDGRYAVFRDIAIVALSNAPIPTSAQGPRADCVCREQTLAINAGRID